MACSKLLTCSMMLTCSTLATGSKLQTCWKRQICSWLIASLLRPQMGPLWSMSERLRTCLTQKIATTTTT